MNSIRVLFVLAAIVFAAQADDDKDKKRAIFRECAEANGLKIEGYKKGQRLSGTPPQEVLCTMKCTMEKEGVLSDGKINIEEARKDPELKKIIKDDKVDSLMDCLKDLEIKECSDVAKVVACGEEARA